MTFRRRDAVLVGAGALIAAGFFFRLWYLGRFGGQYFSGDTTAMMELAQVMASPYDTSPREPLFVWWLWLLRRLGVGTPSGVQAMTLLWFFPNALLLFRWARKAAGDAAGLLALGLFVFLPLQVGADVSGERHVLETFFLLVLQNAMLSSRARAAAAGYAGLCLTRVSYLASGAGLLALGFWRGGLRRLPLLLLPAALLLVPHFLDNKADHGDPLYSVNMHAYWYANKEFIGRPGYHATFEEWTKDAYRKSLTYRRWALEAHTPVQYLRETAVGYARCLVKFPAQDYFGRKVPAFLKWLLLGFYAAGLVLCCRRPGLRFIPAGHLALLFPYAFVSHVFWAPRFFVPFASLILLPTALAALACGEALFRRRSPPENL